MFDSNIVSKNFLAENLTISQIKNNYSKNKPFPNIVIDNFFNDDFLNKISEEFPDLSKTSISQKYKNKDEVKFANNDFKNFPENIKDLINFMNSDNFIEFLQNITSIKEKLISDPELNGGGLHEIKSGGYLKIHTDFNKHPNLNLDRRINILIYLNKNWKDNNGGQLELWDNKMNNCVKNILPVFNRMVIFSTTDFSYHGNPKKVKISENLSRKSIALYYYSNGRPASERNLGLHSTIFRKRPGTNDIDGNLEFKKLFGKLYLKSKKKIV